MFPKTTIRIEELNVTLEKLAFTLQGEGRKPVPVIFLTLTFPSGAAPVAARLMLEKKPRLARTFNWGGVRRWYEVGFRTEQERLRRAREIFLAIEKAICSEGQSLRGLCHELLMEDESYRSAAGEQKARRAKKRRRRPRAPGPDEVLLAEVDGWSAWLRRTCWLGGHLSSTIRMLRPGWDDRAAPAGISYAYAIQLVGERLYHTRDLELFRNETKGDPAPSRCLEAARLRLSTFDRDELLALCRPRRPRSHPPHHRKLGSIPGVDGVARDVVASVRDGSIVRYHAGEPWVNGYLVAMAPTTQCPAIAWGVRLTDGFLARKNMYHRYQGGEELRRQLREFLDHHWSELTGEVEKKVA